MRQVIWGACVLLLVTSGCARFGWKNASRDDLDGEASFVTTAVAPKPSATPPAAAASAAKSAAPAATPTGEQAPAPIVNAPPKAPATELPAKVAAANAAPTTMPAATKTTSPDIAALKADTLTRLRTLPDVTPEQLAEFERSLAPDSGEASTMYLQQLNALVKFRQEEAKKKSAPQELPEFAEARALATKPKPAPPAPEEPKEPAEVAQASYEETPMAELPPIITSKTWADRLRQSQESSSQTNTKSGIFSGRVQTSTATGSLSDSSEEKTPSATHTTNKPASEIPPSLSPSDKSTNSAASTSDATSTTSATASADWRKNLTETIAALESQLRAEELPPAERLRCEAGIRLLYVLADRRDDALREIENIDAPQQDYWRSQLHSLQVSLATDGTPVPGRRATLALRPLREAVDQLGSLATLDVRNVAFCSEVSMWGQYKEFPKYEFKSDQEVLLYFEVENFTAIESEQGFATEFISSYEIFDAAGRRVAEQQFPSASETCRNRRRDYFIRYHMHVPKQLTAGEYTLQLTVEDQKGHKFGQGSAKFKVM